MEVSLLAAYNDGKNFGGKITFLFLLVHLLVLLVVVFYSTKIVV